MTCNPNYPQILAAISHGATPVDRPNSFLRVFKQHIPHLVHALLRKKVPGRDEINGLIKGIDLQKIGLPHVHILVILDGANTKTAVELKIYTTAEIPDKNNSMKDWRNVVKFMLHRPCKEMNMEASCCQNKYESCEKRFPKDYATHTRFEEDNVSPIYLRRSSEWWKLHYSHNYGKHTI